MYIDINKVMQAFYTYLDEFFKSGKKLPKIKFVFNEDALAMYLSTVPKRDNSYTRLLTSYIKKSLEDYDTEYKVRVTNAKLFFQKLTTLVNLHAKVYQKYNADFSSDAEIEEYLKYLWLRMTPQDFLDVQKFLDREISYLMNEEYFDNLLYYQGIRLSSVVVGEYEGYTITAFKDMNNHYFETDLCLRYVLYDKERKKSYNLPMIHYGIETLNDKPVCHIYALQKCSYAEQDNKIGRSLYKLNSGINEPLNHPSFVLSLNLFMNLLRENNIEDIEVPLLEVLNYGYHEKIGESEKEKFRIKWEDSTPEDDFDKEIYEEDLKILNRTADKQDSISKAKVENLTNLFLRYQEQYDDISISVEDFLLKIKIKNMNKMI